MNEEKKKESKHRKKLKKSFFNHPTKQNHEMNQSKRRMDKRETWEVPTGKWNKRKTPILNKEGTIVTINC